MKTFLFGDKHKKTYNGLMLSYYDSYYYLVETNYGEIKQLELTFGISLPYGKKDEKFKAVAEETQYELTLFKSEGGTLGNIINSEPIKVICEEGRAWDMDKKIDVSAYGIVDSSFFIRLKKVTSIDKDKCYYVPLCFKSEKRYTFVSGEKPGELKPLYAVGRGMGLMVKVKMLTQDY